MLAVTTGLGLLICSAVDALARATLSPPPLIYWLGVLLIGVPIFFRLASPHPSATERFTLVALLGMALYVVKLMRDSLLFSFSDEYVHAFNADQIVETHHLFEHNPIIPATPDFPGLEGATSALMALTGMSSYGAGILVIGAGRLILMAGLFLLFKRVIGSARIAGIATAIYAGSSNFLLWGAQFSYQSLALPLFVVVLVLVAERAASPRQLSFAWGVPIVLLTATIVITHHLTSYALVGALGLLALLFHRTGNREGNPWPFALLAFVLASAWLVGVAGTTVEYLSPVLERAFDSIRDTVGGASSPRGLFEGSAARPGGGTAIGETPILAKLVALVSVGILLAGLPLGLMRVWRYRRRDPFALFFCLSAIAFFATLGLRFAPAAWETGNRAGEFMFIGLSFVLAVSFGAAYGLLAGRGPRRAPGLGRRLLIGSFGIVLVGGAISGWPWDSQLAEPIRGEVGGERFESEPAALARWTSEYLPDRRYAAPVADGRLLLTQGGAVSVRVGGRPAVDDILQTPALADWQLRVLRRYNLRYVVSDRRIRADDNVRGYSASVHPPGGDRDDLLPEASVTKFESLPGTARIFDSGKVVVYDREARR